MITKPSRFTRAMPFHIVVYPRRGGYWSALVTCQRTGKWRLSQREYRSANEAKLAAFDVLLAMLEKRNIK